MGVRRLAQELRISVTTVSRALNDYPDIAPDTRRRVLEAAERIGYSPNAVARSLRQGRANAVGIVLPTPEGNFSDPFLSALLAGISNRLRCDGLDLIVTSCPPGPDEEPSYKRLFAGRKVDSVIVTRTRVDDDRIRLLLAENFPFVAFGRSDAIADPFPWVDLDGHAAFFSMTRRLIEAGHRRIGLIHTGRNLNFVRHRTAGWRDCLVAEGIPAELCGKWMAEAAPDAEGGRRAAFSLLSQSDAPTALVCISDDIAFGAIEACRELSLPVGDGGISIVGFDDNPYARFASPPLTSQRQPVRDIGCTLVDMLQRRSTGAPASQLNCLMQAEFVTRSSHGRPPCQATSGRSGLRQ
ncbi:substrate-binding domain-containing protein [Microvirga lotononidis]|uniref:Transcriptional regulator n=1 Tax=Microvirga lotononidis TaxID=864069 RepID=I4YXI1_9HYPH|nr:substrate-binding domain-containing protein [Microvirga lotononidis]EIM28673.1 transcriptional regulator [Microvirga lotononidis]WQO25586.1 substrate-binding domain-containing protein [Microvirga lotononidis]